MDLKIDKADLTKALSHTQTVVERRTTVPILSHILLEANDTNLKLTATDLEISVIENIPAEISTPGRLAVPAHLFYEIARKLPDSLVSIQVSEDRNDSNSMDDGGQGSLFVKAGKAKFKLPYLPADDYPAVNVGDLPCKFRLPASHLRSVLEKTRFAMSNEETRYYLNGIYLHAYENKELRGVATDGHRLAQASVDLPQGAENMPGVIISRKTISELMRILDGDDEIDVAVSEIQITFHIKGVMLISRLIDGTFPDYEGVIPKNNNKHLCIQVKPFSQAVDRVSTISLERAPEVKLSLDTNKLTLSAQNMDSGVGQEDIEVDYAQESIQMGFNARFLMDITQQIRSDEAEISFSDSVSPVIIKDTVQGKSLFVVMPLRG